MLSTNWTACVQTHIIINIALKHFGSIGNLLQYGTPGLFVFGLFEVDAEDAGHGGDVSIVEAEHGVAVSVGVPQKLRCR